MNPKSMCLRVYYYLLYRSYSEYSKTIIKIKYKNTEKNTHNEHTSEHSKICPQS